MELDGEEWCSTDPDGTRHGHHWKNHQWLGRPVQRCWRCGMIVELEPATLIDMNTGMDITEVDPERADALEAGYQAALNEAARILDAGGNSYAIAQWIKDNKR